MCEAHENAEYLQGTDLRLLRAEVTLAKKIVLFIVSNLHAENDKNEAHLKHVTGYKIRLGDITQIC